MSLTLSSAPTNISTTTSLAAGEPLEKKGFTLPATAALRRSVAGAKAILDAKDYAYIVDIRERTRSALSVADLVSSGNKIPLLVEDENGDVQTIRSTTLSQTPSFLKISETSGSTILKSLRKLPRLRGPAVELCQDRRLQREVERRKLDRNEKLVKAAELTKAARTVLDCSRLQFEAAILFDEIGMLEKAAISFKNATKRTAGNATVVVDTYDLPESVQYRRKLERMSDRHRVVFLQQRAELRAMLIAAEEERQRLRAMVSFCQLVRIYMLLEDFDAAHSSLCAAFKLTVSPAEHSELLVYSHGTLKEFSTKMFGELSKAQQIVRSSAGPLAEAHINILYELLEEDARNPDVLEWLGIRFAERCDFEDSRAFFKRARDLREPSVTADTMRDMFVMRPEGFDDAEYLKAISKAKMRKYAQNVGDDLQRFETRTDYASFGGKHQASETIIYSLPPQGWDAGAAAQLSRLEMLNQTFRLPPNKRHEEDAK